MDGHMRMRLQMGLFLLMVVAHLRTAILSTSEILFRLSAAPIPYNAFEAGTTDGKIAVSYVNLNFSDSTLNGLSIFGKGRKALPERFGLDGMAGLMYLSGKLPGVGPLSPLPAYSATGSFLGYYTPIPAKTANATSVTVSFSGNAEVQVVRSPLFNAIIFAGPSLNITSLTLKTLYNKYYAATGTTYTGFTDTLTTTLMLGGLQAGMQIDIPLGQMLRVSPFFVVSSLSGSATMTDDPGTKTSDAYSATFEVPASTTFSTGFDVFVNEISIGAMAQSGKSSQNGGNASYYQLTVGYRFSSKDAAAETVTEEAQPAKPAEENKADPAGKAKKK